MSIAVFDPSYDYEQNTADVDGRTVVIGGVITTSHDLVLYQSTSPEVGLASVFPVPRDAELRVFGDVVRIRGRIEVPGQAVTIFCRRLEAEAVGSTPAAIVVDGKPGAPPPEPLPAAASGGKGRHGSVQARPVVIRMEQDLDGGTGETGHDGQKGDDGKAGGKGGAIRIYCAELAPDIVLILSANGGIGGKGQDGQPGGRGGPGGDGQDQVRAFLDLGAKDPTSGGKGGAGGTGGKGGAGGRGGDGGTVTLKAVVGSNSKITMLAKPGPGGAVGNGGGRGEGGSPGAGGTYMEVISHRGPRGPVYEQIPARLGDHGSGAPGSVGLPGDAAPDDPAKGGPKPGSTEATVPCKLADFASLVRPEHMRMIYAKARLHYLAAGEKVTNEDELANAHVLLAWMNDALDVVPDGAPGRAACRDLLTMVCGLLSNVACGLNFFGTDPDYVPRSSLERYRNWLTDSLSSLQLMETANAEYAQELKERTTQHAYLKNVSASVSSQIAYYDEKLSETSTNIKNAVARIGQTETAISAARETLRATLDKFADAVTRHFQVPGIEQLTGIVESLSFLPHTPGEAGPQKAAMLSSQAAKLLTASLDEVRTASGASYKKEYIVHQIDVFGRDVSSLHEGYSIAKDRRLTLQDPNAYQLLIQRDTFDRLCDSFYKDPTVPADQARAAMDSFVEKVQIRNDAVLAYNNFLFVQEELKKRKQYLDTERQELEKKRAENAAPGLLQIRLYMANAYESAKERCIWNLYRAVRAYVFWSLEDYSLFDHLLQHCPLADLNHAVLSEGRDTILKKLQDAMEKLARPEQSFSRFTVKLSSFPGALAELKAKNIAMFALPPVRKDTSVTQSPFAGMSHVRITKVRPWAVGLQTRNNMHHLVITHLGEETMVNKQDEPLSFSHEAVDTTFIYDSRLLGRDEAFAGKKSSEDGTLVDPQGGTDYAQIGPFGTWSIAIPEHLQDGAAMSTLNDVLVDFYGSNLTL